jgi:hypothetical protein
MKLLCITFFIVASFTAIATAEQSHLDIRVPDRISSDLHGNGIIKKSATTMKSAILNPGQNGIAEVK